MHVDVADGQFAPNLTWPLVHPDQSQELAAFARISGLPPMKLEVHLMAVSPEELGAQFAQAGFSTVGRPHRSV